MRDQFNVCLKPQPCLISSNPTVAAEISASFTPSDISPGRCCCFGPDSLSLCGHMSCFSLRHRAIPCAVVCSHGRRVDWWMSGLNAGRLEISSRTAWACHKSYNFSSNTNELFCCFFLLTLSFTGSFCGNIVSLSHQSHAELDSLDLAWVLWSNWNQFS